MLHLRIICPTSSGDEVCALLTAEPGVTNLMLLLQRRAGRAAGRTAPASV